MTTKYLDEEAAQEYEGLLHATTTLVDEKLKELRSISVVRGDEQIKKIEKEFFKDSCITLKSILSEETKKRIKLRYGETRMTLTYFGRKRDRDRITNVSQFRQLVRAMETEKAFLTPIEETFIKNWLATYTNVQKLAGYVAEKVYDINIGGKPVKHLAKITLGDLTISLQNNTTLVRLSAQSDHSNTNNFTYSSYYDNPEYTSRLLKYMPLCLEMVKEAQKQGKETVMNAEKTILPFKEQYKKYLVFNELASF